MNVASLLAQYSYGTDLETQPGDAGASMMSLFIWLAVVVLVVAGMWKTFQKAGQPGWASIIPLYNTYILLKMAGRPGWWLLLYLIPIVNLIVHLMVSLDVARAFGKSDLFGVFGLWFFSFVGYLILGFGSDKYKGVPKH
jgi:hypothetical protein